MEEQKIHLELTLDEVNIIFQALGTRPFNEVFQLVAKINEQASQQFSETTENEKTEPKTE